MIGASLVLRYPGIASVPCSRCITILGDFIDGEWVASTRAGVEIPRNGGKPPCWKCPKLSEADRRNDPRPENAVEMSAQNWRAWAYYNEVQAGAPMADDPVTRRICGSLRMMEKELEREDRKRGTRTNG